MEKNFGKVEFGKESNNLRIQLPQSIRQSVMDIIESDPTSCYYYKIKKGNYEMRVILIEQNEQEHFTICHCFTTDTLSHSSDNYTYESCSLETFSSISIMLKETGLA